MAKALKASNPETVKDSLFLRKTRAAALLHDVGHPPLSHALEHHLMKAYDKQTATSMVDPKLGENVTNRPVVTEIKKLIGSEQNPFDNSVLSALLVAKSSISATLSKDGLPPDEIAKAIAGKALPQYYSQILDAGLDADKMDYLQRDMHGTGIPYGSFDIGQILRCLQLENDSICVHEVGANACLHFLLIRYFWYTQVILNKHVNAYEEMAKWMYDSLASIGLLPTSVQLLDKLDGIVKGEQPAENWWAEFDDKSFLSAMAEAKRLGGKKDTKSSSPLSPEDLVEYINRVQNRIPLPRIVRIDSVEIPRRRAANEVVYENQHPRFVAYVEFTKWLNENKKDELAHGRIIISERKIQATKPREMESPILVKTKYDKKSIILQQHYYSVILPMAVDFPEHPIRFATNRVFCAGDLEDELRSKWNKIVGR